MAGLPDWRTWTYDPDWGMHIPSEIPGTPYSIPFGGSFRSGFPSVQYSGKLPFQPRYEIIPPKESAGSFVESQDLGVVCVNPTV